MIDIYYLNLNKDYLFSFYYFEYFNRKEIMVGFL